MERFFEKLTAALQQGSFVKLTLSKPVAKSDELRNVYIKPVRIKDRLMYSFTYRYDRRDETLNYDMEQFVSLIESLLNDRFLSASLFTVTEDITLLISRKGKPTLICKPVKEYREADLEHDHVKNRLIDPRNIWWFRLGLTTREGKVLADMQHKFKQICKYVEIVDSLIRNTSFDDELRIAYMGAGKGYLTFALYEHLSKHYNKRFILEGVEVREDIVLKVNEIIRDCQMPDFDFIHSTIEDYKPQRIDVLIALHACNTATDDAIIKGIENNAKLLICAPCCHKQIRAEMEKSGVSDCMTRYGIFLERQAVMITDTIRALIMEYFGYKTQIMEFIEMEHTPKNVLLVGRKTVVEPDKELIIRQIQELKKRYGIQRHYLERIFELMNLSY